MLDQLDPLLLRQVALHFANPAGLLGTCPAAWHAASDETFLLEWFCKWQPVMAPYRPWQYAAITWQRLRCSQSSPEQLAHFMLRYLQYQQQQQQQQQQPEQGTLHQKLAATGITEPQHGSAHSSAAIAAADAAEMGQLQQQQQPASITRAWLRSPHPYIKTGGEISPFPACRPRLSTLRAAQHLAHQGRGLHALLLLCPGSTCLLVGYAAKAGNAALLRQLMAYKRESEYSVYPMVYMEHCYFYAAMPSVWLACQEAMRQGWPDMLGVMLAGGASEFKWLAPQLLRFAAAYSNAACLEQVLAYAAAVEQGVVQPSPHHLAVAAGRSDSWSMGVVKLLLSVLPVKQLTPKWLRPAYQAACGGNTTVLQALLAAGNGAVRTQRQQQQQHAMVVLGACAAAGNVAVWQQLLELEGGSSGQQQSGKQQHSAQQQQVHLVQLQQQQQLGSRGHVHLPPICVAVLAPQQWLALLHAVLPQQSGDVYDDRSTAQQRLEVDARFSMAEQVWQLLQLQPGLESAVRQQLHTTGSWELLCAGLDIEGLSQEDWADLAAKKAAADAAAATKCAVAGALSKSPAVQQDGSAPAYEASSSAAVPAGQSADTAVSEHLLENIMLQLPQARLLWLDQRGLLYGEAANQLVLKGAWSALVSSVLQQQHRRALEWYQVVRRRSALAGLGSPVHCRSALSKQHLGQAVWESRVRAACQAGDLTALQQLEQLANLSGVLRHMTVLATAYTPLILFSPAAAAAAARLSAATGPAWHGRTAATAAGPAMLEHTTTALPVVGRISAADAVWQFPPPWKPSAELQTQLSEESSLKAAATKAALCADIAAVARDGSSAFADVSGEAATQSSSTSACSFNAEYALQLAEQLGVACPLPKQLVTQHLPRQKQLSAQPEVTAAVTQHAADVMPAVANALQADEYRQIKQACESQQEQPQCSLSPHQQQQCNQPGPLWQQALLVVLSSASAEATDGLEVLCPPCSDAEGVSDQAWQLLTWAAASDASFRSALPTGQRGTVGPFVADVAVKQLRPRLLAWVLQQPWLWEQEAGSNAKQEWLDKAQILSVAHAICCPFTAVATAAEASTVTTAAAGANETSVELAATAIMPARTDVPAAADMSAAATGPTSLACAAAEGVQTGQLCAAQSAVEIAMVLLQSGNGYRGQPLDIILSRWLNMRMSASSTAEHIARAKAVLVAVASAAVVPAGAGQLERKALSKVLKVGDVDLLAMLLMWACRLPAQLCGQQEPE